MANTLNSYQRLLVLTDLGKIRVLGFTEPSDDPTEKIHLTELAEEELEAPRGAKTTDTPGKFNRGYEAGEGDAMSHAETKLDVEVEKRSINQVANEICSKVMSHGCKHFILAAPQEHLKRLVAEMTPDCKALMVESHGLDLTKEKLPALENRFL
ncbi:host attachment protein [Verrucomicrobiaceae bacterium R5-34]|uniref:Host attachment protein n=1 Tax=Oceaniferula flava TaxID=2800421 RepID=A0AAE2SCL4_9BACT|nr:host attachment protein [Oceaniferula flavus]MBK1830878.1 host attachment protein [Verrucomicrobiaceae bacterium R5-34]MBK1855725.1 host attachment protein [Oceaniferula flavus]MBM1137032.1 host attachment protein [Oceaniferula flavus]